MTLHQEATSFDIAACLSQRRRVDADAGDEFLCPITRALPIDPVTAEDGRVYERSAIEEWFSKQGEHIWSPVMNAPMGKTLLPAVQVRNTIRNIVKSGAMSDEKAGPLKQIVADEEEVAKLRREADAGEAKAMVILGLSYRDGLRASSC